MQIFNYVAILPGYLMSFLSDLFGGNFALAVFVFTLLINVALLPLSIKSQKSSVQQTRIKPKLDELKKRYGDDRQKYSAAMQKLYQEEGVSMSGGCLPMVIRLVLMLSIYQIILSPLTYMVHVKEEPYNRVSNAVTDVIKGDDALEKKFKSYSWDTSKSNRNQLPLIKIINDDEDLIQNVLSEKKYASIASDYETIKSAVKKSKVDFDFFGIDLTQKPNFNIDVFHYWENIWIMPLLAFAAQMLTSVVSSKIQKKANPDAPNMMGLMLTMPLISLIIGFNFAGGVTFYWACSSLIGGFIQVETQQFYGPHKMLAAKRVKELVKEYNTEKTQMEKVENSAAGTLNGETLNEKE